MTHAAPGSESQPAEQSCQAVGQLFDEHRNRLKLTVRLRMDHRLRGRIDASDAVSYTHLTLPTICSV